MPNFDLTGKKALVTGSSRGIGRAAALTLAEYGADVVVHCAGRMDAAESAADEIRAMGRRALAVKKDLLDADCADVIWEAVEREFGGVDILVLNASIQYKKPWEQMTARDFDEQMAVNARAPLLLAQKAVPYMRERRWGRIVTVGSVQEYKPHPGMIVYSMSKAAQTMMMRTLAAQLGADGITVNNLAPGVINTDRNKELELMPDYAARLRRQIPLGRFGEAGECMGALMLLCSDAGSYITGGTILADGGKSL